MSWQNRIDQTIDELAARLVGVRRYLHAHPEPSGVEIETTRYLAEQLRDQGIEARIPATGRGVIADTAASGRRPRVLLRADIDALRMPDEKDVPYRSTVPGVTHACGHDAHAAIVFGALLALQRNQAELPVPLACRAVFQPAEETSTGAIEMVEAGAVDDVDAALALHVDPERNVGRAAFRAGTLTAFCDEIDVVVRGRGGHAARPHHSSDPIVAACQFVTSVYQLVPRALDSREPAVLTFGSVHGGTARNVIPEEVHVRGTARTYSHTATSRLEERVLAIAHGVAEASGTHIEVAFKRGPDAVINDVEVTELCIAAASALLGADAIEPIGAPSLGGEDFAEFLARVPGCLFRLGVARPDSEAAMLHTSRFDIDEAALTIGAKLLARSAVHVALAKEARP